MSQLTITNARILDPETGRDEVGNILMENGLITAIGSVDPKGEIIDAGSLIAAPGLIDMRVSTGEPGAENRETLASAAKAAARGGVTSMVIMPDTDPVIDDMSLIDFVHGRGQDTDVNIYVAGALTKALDGSTMTEMGLMSEAGAVMFSNGPTPISDSLIMRRLLAYGARFNALIANRPLDAALSKG